jgi:hypothetical protein
MIFLPTAIFMVYCLLPNNVAGQQLLASKEEK